MSSKRFFFVLLGLTSLFLILFGGGVFQANKMVHNEGDQLVAKKLEKTVLDKQASDLLQAKRDVLELEELSTLTESIIPRDKDQARTIVEINTLARGAGIRLGSIEFPASELGQVQKKGSKASSTTNDQLTQLKPVDDIKGMYIMEITINSHSETPIPYSRLISFLEGLEKNRRTAQVVSINITPEADDPTLITFTVVLNAYVKPETQ